MLRFIGMARSTPSAATHRIHAQTTYQRSCVPRGLSSVTDSKSIAGMAVTRSTLVEYPDDDAVDCMQLFSRIVIGDFATPSLSSDVEIVKDAMQAVSAML